MTVYYGLSPVTLEDTGSKLTITDIIRFADDEDALFPTLDKDSDGKVIKIRINSVRDESRTNMTIEQLASVNPVSRPHLDVLRDQFETIKYLPNSAELTGLLDAAYEKYDHDYDEFEHVDSPPVPTWSPTVTMTPTPSMTVTPTVSPTITGSPTLNNLFHTLTLDSSNNIITSHYADGYVGIRFNARAFTKKFYTYGDDIKDDDGNKVFKSGLVNFHHPFFEIEVEFETLSFKDNLDSGYARENEMNEFVYEDGTMRTDYETLYDGVYSYTEANVIQKDGDNHNKITIQTYFKVDDGKDSEYSDKYFTVLKDGTFTDERHPYYAVYHMFPCVGTDPKIKNVSVVPGKLARDLGEPSDTYLYMKRDGGGTITHGENDNHLTSFDTPTPSVSPTPTATMTFTTTTTVSPTVTTTVSPTVTTTPTVTITEPTPTPTVTVTETLLLFDIGSDTLELIDSFDSMIIIQEFDKRATASRTTTRDKRMFFTV